MNKKTNLPEQIVGARHFFLPLAAVLGLALAGCGKPSDLLPAASDRSSAPVSTAQPAPGDHASTPAELHLRWTKGERQHQRMEMRMRMETSGAPIPKPMKQDVTMNMEFTITALGPREGGGQELEMELGDADMSVKMGGRELMSFDSRGESLGGDNSPADLFRALVGAKLSYFLNGSNRVEKVEGWEELMKKVSAEAPAAGRGVMAGILTEEYFKELADFGLGLPNRAVKPGETWTDQREIVMGPLGKLVLDLTYTFKGWEVHDRQTCAAVTFTGTASPKQGENASSHFGKLKAGNGKTSGTYWFNTAAGRLIETALQQEMNLVLDIAGAGPPARPGAVPGSSLITNLISQDIQVKFSTEGAN